MHNEPVHDEHRSPTLGVIALAVTVLVWSGFFLSLRFGAKIDLPPLEIAILRFGPGTLIFLPIAIRHRRRFLNAPRLPMALMVLGSGFPYLMVAGTGMSLAPVADGSTILPGLNPVFVSLIGFWLLRRPIPRTRRLGLGLILAGIGLLLSHSIMNPTLGLLEGYVVFVVAGLMWATFTLAFEKSGLRPIEGAAVVTFGSLPLLVGALLWRGTPLQLMDLGLDSLIPMFVAQGIGVGLLSTIAYTTAVRHLGANRAAMAGALTPVVSTVLAIVLLSEHPFPTTLAGMAIIIAGVALSNRR
jgi:drug/metabolite transporter (DMT)-like permease